MRPCWFILLALLLIWVPTGCTLFNPPQRLARIQIIGPGNHTKEFVLSIDALESEKATGIKLTDRYAIEIDLQWLWYEFEDLNFSRKVVVDDPEAQDTPMTPWFICKYRF